MTIFFVNCSPCLVLTLYSKLHVSTVLFCFFVFLYTTDVGLLSSIEPTDPVALLLARKANSGEERQVTVTLDRTYDVVVFLTVTPTSSGIGHNSINDQPDDASTTDTTTKIVETLKIEKESLSKSQMEVLQSGCSLDASVTSLTNFRIRDNDSGTVVPVQAESIHHELRKLTSATLCGNTIARGLVSISFDGDETSFLAKTSYSRFVPAVLDESTELEHDTMTAGQRHLSDICEKIDGLIGGCTQSATCFLPFSRRKRVQQEVCLSASG